MNLNGWLKYFLLLLTVIVAGSTYAGYDDADVTHEDNEFVQLAEKLPVWDIAPVLQKSSQTRLPIMLVITTAGCEFCERLKEEYIFPMMKSGEYDNRVIMGEIYSVSWRAISNQDGKRITTEDFVHQYGVRVYPTLIFIDHRGKLLPPRITGYNTPSLYGGRIDLAIEQAELAIMSRF